MAEYGDEIEATHEPVIENITERNNNNNNNNNKIDRDDDDSDSESEKKMKFDDDDVKKQQHDDVPVKMKSRYRLFGRDKPVHQVLGGGKPADIFLWRNKKISASVFGGVTALWVLFELLEYRLVTLVCHILILVFAVLFVWSSASKIINKSPPRVPEVKISEDTIHQFASALRIEVNNILQMLRGVAAGRDPKKFIAVVVGLWVLSVVGSWCNFLTLFYMSFVALHTVPVLYEKYEDQVDALAEKAMIELKKRYAMFDEKVVSKIPLGPLKNKKRD